MAGVTMGLLVQGDMATPVIADLGTKEQIAEFLTPAHPGREDRRARRERAERRQRRRRHPDLGEEGRRRLHHQRREDVHHERLTRADFVTLLVKTNPDAGAQGCSFFLVPTKTKGFSVSKKLQEDRQPLERHGRAVVRGHARPQALPPRRREPRVHVPDAELPERARHRLHERRRRAGADARRERSRTAATARRSASRSSSASTGSTSSSSSTRQARGRARAHLQGAPRRTTRTSSSRRAASASRRRSHISMAKIFVGDIGSEIADQCLQFHGGAGYIEEYPSPACGGTTASSGSAAGRPRRSGITWRS